MSEVNSELEALKALWGGTTAKQSHTTTETPFWKKRFDFWKMKAGDQVVVRFLPDLDANNPLKFAIENVYHELYVNGKKKLVPCLKMYGKACPCCTLSAKYYDEKNETLGKKYYKKREYVYAVKIVNVPFDVDNLDETKYVTLGPKLHKIIGEAIKSNDLEAAPYNLTQGHDFRIKKSQQGEHANYDLSSFAPKSSSLPEEVLNNLELLDLKTLRTAEISIDQMNLYLLADQTGQSVESMNDVANSASVATSSTVHVDTKPVVESKPVAEQPAQPRVETPVEQPKAAASDVRVQSILDQIRANAGNRA